MEEEVIYGVKRSTLEDMPASMLVDLLKTSMETSVFKDKMISALIFSMKEEGYSFDSEYKLIKE